jgi:sodium/potassium-transporting ATPase subunit alpha
MVTGDFSITAAAIASQIGIFSSSQYDTAAVMKEKSLIPAKVYSKEELSELQKRYGLFIPDQQFKSLLLTGSDLEQLEDHHWRTITRYEEIVFARTTPSQKLRVVEEFKLDKNVVAVTGDGVNDSPALKAANIGNFFVI